MFISFLSVAFSLHQRLLHQFYLYASLYNVNKKITYSRIFDLQDKLQYSVRCIIYCTIYTKTLIIRKQYDLPTFLLERYIYTIWKSRKLSCKIHQNSVNFQQFEIIQSLHSDADIEKWLVCQINLVLQRPLCLLSACASTVSYRCYFSFLCIPHCLFLIQLFVLFPLGSLSIILK